MAGAFWVFTTYSYYSDSPVFCSSLREKHSCPHKNGATDYVCHPIVYLKQSVICNRAFSISLSDLHLVALTTFILHREGILALIMTGTTGFAGLHVAHGTLHGPSLERENLGVAIGAFVGLRMELMAEGCLTGGCFKSDFARLHTSVAFITITSRRKGILAVVADTTGFAFDHIIHGGFADNSFVGKSFGMAIFAAIRPGMECMAESGRCYPLQIECDLFRLECFVATVTVCRYSKSAFSVVA